MLAGCLQGAYLLAVLAENPCTHQCLKAEGCVELLLHLMHHGGPRAARAANAAVVSLATNADNHFGLVSLGLAPALVATLQAGKSSHTASGARCMLHKFLRMLSLVLGFVLGARPQQGNPVLALCAQRGVLHEYTGQSLLSPVPARSIMFRADMSHMSDFVIASI